jgi:putative ABC transport system substrate-binding protein
MPHAFTRTLVFMLALWTLMIGANAYAHSWPSIAFVPALLYASAINRGRNGSRWIAIFAISILLMRAALPADAADQRPYRIGVLNEAFAANHPTVEGLRAGLRDLGFEEGRHVVFDIRFSKGDPKSLAPAAQALVKEGVDLLFTSNEVATHAAQAATRTIPIVFTLVGDPIASGVVKQLARPGGNLTGISSLTSDLMPKRLEILKTLYPGVRRVWFIHDATDPTGAAALKKGMEAAQQLRIELTPLGVADAPHVVAVLKTLQPGDALLAPDQDGFDIGASILEKSLEARVPAMFPSSLWIEHGGLVSYGPDYYAQGLQAAQLVAKILRGRRPADLPVESADRVYFTLNVKTAVGFGLSVPSKVLFRADGIKQ